jgi:hypothetical protein
MGLIDNQVPHLSATVPCEIDSACRIRTGVRLIEGQVAWTSSLTRQRGNLGWAEGN